MEALLLPSQEQQLAYPLDCPPELMHPGRRLPRTRSFFPPPHHYSFVFPDNQLTHSHGFSKASAPSSRSISTPRAAFLGREKASLLTSCSQHAQDDFVEFPIRKKFMFVGAQNGNSSLEQSVTENKFVEANSAWIYTHSSKDSSRNQDEKIAPRKNSVARIRMEIDSRSQIQPRSQAKSSKDVDFPAVSDAELANIESGTCPFIPGWSLSTCALVSPGFSPLEIPKVKANGSLNYVKKIGDSIVQVPDDERWAGPAFSNSPPPSSLPLPKFPMRQLRTSSLEIVLPKEGCDDLPTALRFASAPSSPSQKSNYLPYQPFANRVASRSGIDIAVATKDLRRILNLDIDQ